MLLREKSQDVHVFLKVSFASIDLLATGDLLGIFLGLGTLAGLAKEGVMVVNTYGIIILHVR